MFAPKLYWPTFKPPILAYFLAAGNRGHPGHGPQYLWNTTVKGKSYAKSIPLGPELEKYTTEIGNYHNLSSGSVGTFSVPEANFVNKIKGGRLKIPKNCSNTT
jgi:hypothetical protein